MTNYSDLVKFFKRYGSNRCAAYVAATLLGMRPLPRQAQEHIDRNGGQHSEKAAKLLAWATSKTPSELEVRIEQALAFAVAPVGLFIEWDELEAYRLCAPLEAERLQNEFEKEAAAWWEREGRYESLAEDQGTYKDYLYACQVAEQFSDPQPHISEFVR